MIKRITALLALFVSLLAMTASPAQAAPTGSIYFYRYADTSDLLTSFTAASKSPSVCYTMPSSANNRTSYITNGASVSFVVFDNSTCSSTPGLIYAHSSGPMTGQFNDSISSYYRNP